jgi:hypothetical protein
MDTSDNRGAESSAKGLVAVSTALDNSVEAAINEAGKLLAGAAGLILRRRGTSKAAEELAEAWKHSRAALRWLA